MVVVIQTVHQLHTHHDLLGGGITGTLAQSVHAGMDHIGAGFHCRKATGSCHAKVVVGMDLQRDTVLFQATNKHMNSGGQTAAYGIHYADGVGTGFRYQRGVQPVKDRHIRAAGIKAKVDGLQPQLFGISAAIYRFLDQSVGIPLRELVFQLHLTGGDLNHDTGGAAFLGSFNVLMHTTGKGINLRLGAGGGDLLNRIKIRGRNGRHTRLNALYAQLIQHGCDLYLLVSAHEYPGGLLAVSQGRVMNFYLGSNIQFTGKFFIIVIFAHPVFPVIPFCHNTSPLVVPLLVFHLFVGLSRHRPAYYTAARVQTAYKRLPEPFVINITNAALVFLTSDQLPHSIFPLQQPEGTYLHQPSLPW